MTTGYNRFGKEWASSGVKDTPTDAQSSTGFSYLGDQPPTEEMFNALMAQFDGKDNWLFNQLAAVMDAGGESPADDDSTPLLAAVQRLIGGRTLSLITSSQSWTVPAGVYRIKYIITGGGGGSIGCQASSTSQLFSGAGGGAGGTCIGYMDVVPGQVIAIVIGAGGSPGAVSSAGTGGNSSIGAIIAHGGAGASLAGATSSAGGIGGVAAGADMNIAGGDGSDGQSGTFLLSGNGGASFWGGGGRAGLAGSHAGVAWGSGAGGVYDSALSGSAYTGAAGAQGVALLEW